MNECAISCGNWPNLFVSARQGMNPSFSLLHQLVDGGEKVVEGLFLIDVLGGNFGEETTNFRAHRGRHNWKCMWLPLWPIPLFQFKGKPISICPPKKSFIKTFVHPFKFLYFEVNFDERKWPKNWNMEWRR